MERPQRLFQVTVEDLPSEFPPLTSLDSDDRWPSIVTLLVADIVGWYGVLRKLGDKQASVAASHRAQNRAVVSRRTAGAHGDPFGADR
jgi:hypothetical protein